MARFNRLFKTIAGGFGLVVGLGFLMPGQTHIERSRIIKAPNALIYNKIDSLRCWEQWSPWAKIDPQVVWTYSEPAVGVGAFYTWAGNRSVGKGKVTIIATKPTTEVTCLMAFEDGGQALSHFKLVAKDSSQTQVTWTFDTEHGLNPFARWMGLFIDSFLGQDYEKGLLELGKVAENTTY